MLCSAAIYTFSAVITYMDGSGEGEWGALVSWLSCVYCVSGAMWVVQLGWNQSFNFRFKCFYKSAFYMISVEMH